MQKKIQQSSIYHTTTTPTIIVCLGESSVSFLMCQPVSLWQQGTRESRYKFAPLILSRICQSGNFFVFMNTLKSIKLLVLASIAVACFVDTVCVADWIVDSPSDKVDAPDAENGKKVRIL